MRDRQAKIYHITINIRVYVRLRMDVFFSHLFHFDYYYYEIVQTRSEKKGIIRNELFGFLRTVHISPCRFFVGFVSAFSFMSRIVLLFIDVICRWV